MKYKYSIITPVYNTKIEEFDRCLNSVVTASNFKEYKDKIELVIINDGSFIDYNDLIKKYSELANVNYIHFDINKGQYEARLTGFENSNGDYILGLDSDDCYEPQIFNKLEEWVTGSRTQMTYWLTSEDRDKLLNDTQKYVITPGRGIWTASEVWNLMFNSYQRYIQGYLVTKCVPRELMMETAKILRYLDLGRVNMFDDQIITDVLMYVLYKNDGTLDVHHDGLYQYFDHHTDTRFSNPTEQDLIDEFDRKSILRKQLKKVWEYLSNMSSRLIDHYIMNRESILGTICRIHSVDFTKGFYDKLIKEFGYALIYIYNNFNGHPFKRFLTE